MKTKAHSAHSLKTLALCEYKYKMSYDEKGTKVEDHDLAAPFGVCVHYALENLYRLHKSRYGTDYRFDNYDYDFIYSKFMEKAAETKVNDTTLLEEGWAIIRTKMDSFDYTEKVIDVEHKFDLATKKGVQFTGFIDKIIELDSNTLAIIDYKTSRLALTQEEADSDIQLSIYDLAASILWPQYKTVILVLDYLRLKPVMTFRRPEQRKLFIDYLENTDKYILEKNPDTIEPSLNSLCGWCAFKGSCPAFVRAIKETPSIISNVSTLSDDELVKKWKDLKGIEKAVESAVRSLKMQVEQIMREKDSDIIGSKERITCFQSTRVSYDVGQLKKIIPTDTLLDMCYVNKTSVDKYIANHKDLADKIKEAASVSYTAPIIKIGKK